MPLYSEKGIEPAAPSHMMLNRPLLLLLSHAPDDLETLFFEKRPMRILVVDDHVFVRKAICSVLAMNPAFSVCGEACNGQEAIDMARELLPDIVVMDISMPRLNGLQATIEIKRLLPIIEIVFVSQHESPEMIRQAFKAGARAYVMKSNVAADLLEAILKASHHEVFVKRRQLQNPR